MEKQITLNYISILRNVEDNLRHIALKLYTPDQATYLHNTYASEAEHLVFLGLDMSKASIEDQVTYQFFYELSGKLIPTIEKQLLSNKFVDDSITIEIPTNEPIPFSMLYIPHELHSRYPIKCEPNEVLDGILSMFYV